MAPARPTRSSPRASPTRRTTSRCAPSRSASASAAPSTSDAPLVDAAPIGDAETDAVFAALEAFPTLILAVSGGADSMALMRLVARWAKRHPSKSRKLIVATVDHQLRPESRGEAEWVAGEAHAAGLEHVILTWRGAKPSTGVQDAARAARYRLLSELARRYRAAGAVAVVTAHTEDDQAETFLMRLARGSGLDGLAAMQPLRPLDWDECYLVRPLLGVPGARLKATLRAAGLSWIEDPSNDSERFERVRLRKAKAALAAAGLTSEKLALSARRLARARSALEDAAARLQADACLDLHAGAYASLDARTFASVAEEVRLRLLARLIDAFGGQAEPARLAKLEALLDRLAEPDFRPTTLGGAMVIRRAGEILVHREPGRSALPAIVLAPGAAAEWDRRFRVAVDPDLSAPVTVAALGRSGFATLRRQLERDPKVPAGAAATLPAFWREGKLLAVPSLAALPWPTAAWTNEARLCSSEFPALPNNALFVR